MNIFFKTPLTLLLTSILSFAGDFYTESTIPDDAGADYVIIKDNRVVDIIDKNLNYSVDTPVANSIPIVNAGSNKNVCVGSSVTLSASASDSDGTITSYAWKKGDVLLSTKPSFVYTASTVGNHDITLTVRDEQGVGSSDVISIYASAYPTVNAGADKSITLGDTVNLSGTASDSDGSISSWLWSGPSGTLGTTSAISYKPSISGIQTLTLTATDNIGCSRSDSMKLTVEQSSYPATLTTEKIQTSYWWCDSCNYRSEIPNAMKPVITAAGGTGSTYTGSSFIRIGFFNFAVYHYSINNKKPIYVKSGSRGPITLSAGSGYKVGAQRFYNFLDQMVAGDADKPTLYFWTFKDVYKCNAGDTLYQDGSTWMCQIN